MAAVGSASKEILYVFFPLPVSSPTGVGVGGGRGKDKYTLQQVEQHSGARSESQGHTLVKLGEGNALCSFFLLSLTYSPMPIKHHSSPSIPRVTCADRSLLESVREGVLLWVLSVFMTVSVLCLL